MTDGANNLVFIRQICVPVASVKKFIFASLNFSYPSGRALFSVDNQGAFPCCVAIVSRFQVWKVQGDLRSCGSLAHRIVLS